MQRILLALSILLCFLCSACSDNNPHGRVAVRGNVTLAGKPLENGTIQFESLPGVQPTVLTGGIIKQGTFLIQAKNGLQPKQEYTVRIRSMEEVPGSHVADSNSQETSAEYRDIIPPQYGNASTLTINTTNQSPIVFNVDMTP